MSVEALGASLADRYRLERQLGAGGMATVYLAHDLKHDRQVAIKVLHEELGAVLGAERFLAEIKTTARLQHPHILPLLDSGSVFGPDKSGPYLFYVMPYVTGETLRARLERERQLPVDDAVRIATEVADALGHAHEQGVVHRDIKPENILLQGGHALVADFGIALAVQQAGSQRMTQTGLSLGTPQYMSPEQAMGERTIDARSDIYALGAVSYEMLTGEPPFSGATVQAIVAKVLTAEPQRPTLTRKSIPVEVEAAVLGALAKLPADRPPNAAEFVRALRGQGTGRTGSSGWASRGDARPTGSRELRIPLLVAAALTVVAGFLGWLAGRPGLTGAAATDRLTLTTILPPAGGSVGERNSMALSPDGRRLAFVVAAQDGSRALWLRRLDRGEAEPLRGTSGADAPFWSPDGRSLGFFAPRGLTVRDERGEDRVLCPAAGPVNASWGSADTIVFNHRGGITAVPAAGGACTTLTPADSTAGAPVAFLPDGRRLLVRQLGSSRDVAVVDLAGQRLATLPMQSPWIGFVAPDLLLYFDGDTRQVSARRLDLERLTLTGPPIRLTSEVRSAGGIPTISVAPSGDLAFLPGTVDRPYLEYDARGVLRDTVRIEGTWTLAVRPAGAGPALVAVAGRLAGMWLYELDSDRGTRLPAPDSAWGIQPVFSPDGGQLAYSVRSQERCTIGVRNLVAGTERLLAHQPADWSQFFCETPLDWSPDGQTLVARRDTSLVLLSLVGDTVRHRLTRPGRLFEARFAPGGGWLAVSSDETGRAEIYLQPLPSGTPVRVSVHGGRWPAWDQDGRVLYFVSPDGGVQQVPIGWGPAPAVGEARTLFVPASWQRSIFHDQGTGFAVSGDGERFLVRVSPAATGVTYLQGWRALAREAGAAGEVPEAR